MKYFLLLAALLAPLMSFAHSGGGLSFEVPAGDYIVDVGYNRELQAGAPVLFEFLLIDNERSPVTFTDAWVRVEQENTVFAGPIFNGALGGARITYEFPRAGAYTLSVRYYNEGKELAFGEIPITVATANGHTLSLVYAIVVGAPVLLVWGYFLGMLRIHRLIRPAAENPTARPQG